MEYSDAAPVDPLTLELFPSAQQSTFEMVEDDGETPLASMAPSRVTYSLVGTAQGAEFIAGPRSGSFVPAPRRVLLRFRAVDKAPSAVTLEGVALASQGSYGALAGGNGWFFDGNDRSLWVSIGKDADFHVVATYDPVLQSPEPAVQVTFRVTTPPGTPQDRKVHVATSLNNWAQVELPWVDGQTAQGTVTVPRGVWFEYKYTLGDWESVEKWAGCLDASNRYTFSKALPVKEDTVEAWNGFCVQ
jgi:alpha-glucosidase